MAFSGDLVDYPLAELLFFFSAHRRSGWLTIQSDVAEIRFTLVQGKLIAAHSDGAPNRLGQRLLTEGCINPIQLETALAEQHRQQPAEALGSILVRLGFARTEEVQHALRAQAVDLFFQILIRPPCLFFFDRGLPDVHTIEIDITLERDVLEAIRRADEWSARQLWKSTVRLNPETSADMLVGVILDDWPTVEAIMDGATNLEEIVVATGWTPQSTHESLGRLQSLEVIFVDSRPLPLDNAIYSLEIPFRTSGIRKLARD